jgi:hypothetical protein
MLSCLAAERCWDRERWAIEEYTWRFDGLRRRAEAGQPPLQAARFRRVAASPPGRRCRKGGLASRQVYPLANVPPTL